MHLMTNENIKTISKVCRGPNFNYGNVFQNITTEYILSRPFIWFISLFCNSSIHRFWQTIHLLLYFQRPELRSQSKPKPKL